MSTQSLGEGREVWALDQGLARLPGMGRVPLTRLWKSEVGGRLLGCTRPPRPREGTGHWPVLGRGPGNDTQQSFGSDTCPQATEQE